MWKWSGYNQREGTDGCANGSTHSTEMTSDTVDFFPHSIWYKTSMKLGGGSVDRISATNRSDDHRRVFQRFEPSPTLR